MGAGAHRAGKAKVGSWTGRRPASDSRSETKIGLAGFPGGSGYWGPGRSPKLRGADSSLRRAGFLHLLGRPRAAPYPFARLGGGGLVQPVDSGSRPYNRAESYPTNSILGGCTFATNGFGRLDGPGVATTGRGRGGGTGWPFLVRGPVSTPGAFRQRDGHPDQLVAAGPLSIALLAGTCWLSGHPRPRRTKPVCRGQACRALGGLAVISSLA